MSNVLAVILPILFFISIGMAYAENPTPYDEWDFNFTDIEIYQNPNNLQELIIKPHVFFDGNEYLGSVNLELIITDPDGSSHSQNARINNMVDNSERSTYWAYPLLSEGTYTINVIMTNTSIDRPGHIFEEKTLSYTVDTFERKLTHVVFIDEDDNDVFMLRNSQLIQNFERLHIEFDLPQQNVYDGIGLSNGEFKKIFDLTTKELFMESEFEYADLEIFLIKEGNLFNFANGQRELLNYVTFSAIHKNVCYSETCESIDYVELEEKEFDIFQYWVIIPVGIVVVGVVVYFFRKDKGEIKSDEINDYIHPDKQ